MSVRPSFKPANMFPTALGTRALPVSLAFAGVTTLAVDLEQEMANLLIDNVQTVYIDNSDNAAPLTLIFPSIPFRIVAQPYSQGFYPVSVEGKVSIIATGVNGTTVPIILYNVPFPYFVWGPVPGVTITPALTNAPISIAAVGAGDNILIAGSLGVQHKLYRLMFATDVPVNVQFKDGTPGGVNLSGVIPLGAGGGVTMQATGIPWLTTSVGNDLVLNVSAACNIGGLLGYTV